MRDWFIKDLGWKLFSVFLALSIWLTVHKILEESAPPPVVAPPSPPSPVAATFTNLPVLIVSAAADVREFHVTPNTVTVTVSGQPEIMATLQANQIHALGGFDRHRSRAQPATARGHHDARGRDARESGSGGSERGHPARNAKNNEQTSKKSSAPTASAARRTSSPSRRKPRLKLGRAAAHIFKNLESQSRGHGRHKIVIGKDTRLSGYMLENAISSGILSMGVDVLFIGPLPTPGVAYVTRSLRADAGIVITASHNPYADNGIKFFQRRRLQADDKIEAKIEELVFSGEIENIRPTAGEIGKAVRIDDALGRYIEFAKTSFPEKSDARRSARRRGLRPRRELTNPRPAFCANSARKSSSMAISRTA